MPQIKTIDLISLSNKDVRKDNWKSLDKLNTELVFLLLIPFASLLAQQLRKVSIFWKLQELYSNLQGTNVNKNLGGGGNITILWKKEIFTLDFKSTCMIMKTYEDFRLRRLTFHAIRYVVQYLQVHSVLHWSKTEYIWCLLFLFHWHSYWKHKQGSSS